MVSSFELQAKGEAIAGQAIEEHGYFLEEIAGYFDSGIGNDEQLSTDLLRLLSERSHLKDSHLVMGRVYDRAAIERIGHMIAGHGMVTPPEAKMFREAANSGRSIHEFLVSWSPLQVRIVAPIFDRFGGLAAFFESVYAVDRQLIRAVLLDVAGAVALCIAVIIVNTVALYPAFLALDRGLIRRSRELLEANLSMVQVLGSALAKRDNGTSGHSYRVTIYAARLGEALGLSPEDMRRLIKGALLHDIGKLATRDSILRKPSRLTPEESEEMKEHVTHGLDIVRRIAWLADAADVVGGHHERWGGGGYPANISGTAIPLPARVFAVADVFDALTSSRPYKPALSFRAAWLILSRDCGDQFDPEILNTFRSVSASCYRQLQGASEERLQLMLEDILPKYFSKA